jgi:prepilin-type N-terminal cleavage/methylation domain-containing protein
MNKRAVTLIELLVALSIYAAIMVSLYGVYSSGMFGSRRLEDRMVVYQKATEILERIEHDLKNIIPFQEGAVQFSGEKNSIRFLAVVDTFKTDGLFQELTLLNYSHSGQALIRQARPGRDSRREDAEPQNETVSVPVADLALNYGVNPGPGQPIVWSDEWKSPETLPQLVRVRVTVKRNAAQVEFERTINMPLAHAAKQE